MSKRRSAVQSDLFAAEPAADDSTAYVATEEYRDLIRADLADVLARVTGAQSLPWRDTTQAMIALVRFRSACERLPPQEGTDLLRRFEAEMDRIDAIFEAKELAAARNTSASGSIADAG